MKYSKEPAITIDIYSILYDLGVSAETTCFFHTAYAIRLAAEHPEKLLLVTKWLYPEVARHYRTNWRAVERNIRRVVALAWERHSEKLETLAKHKLHFKPTPTQLLAVLARSLTNNDAA